MHKNNRKDIKVWWESSGGFKSTQRTTDSQKFQSGTNSLLQMVSVEIYIQVTLYRCYNLCLYAEQYVFVHAHSQIYIGKNN